MKNKVITLLLVLGFFAFIITAMMTYQSMIEKYSALTSEPYTESEDSEQNEQNSVERIVAPDFAVIDQAGDEISLLSFLGKPIIINFWTSWCTYCVEEMQDFQDVYAESGDNVVFMMVNLTDGIRETRADAAAFIKNNNYTMPVYYDTKQSATTAYNIYSIPTTFLIDSEGYIAGVATGPVTAKTLRSAIETLA